MAAGLTKMSGGVLGVAIVVAAFAWMPWQAQARIRVASEVWLGSCGEPLEFLDISEDGTVLMFGSRDGGVQIWRRDGPRWVRRAALEPCPLEIASWLDGPELVLGRCEGGSLTAWDVEGVERYVSIGRIDPAVLAALALSASSETEEPTEAIKAIWEAEGELRGRKEDRHCAHRPGQVPGALPVLIYKGDRDLEFCDPRDGTGTLLYLDSKDSPMDSTLDGRHVAVGTESGHAVVVELEQFGDDAR